MTEKQNRGFTLAELLIVVAIIAVLVAIAIPVFTSQLEKSREATDLANVRSAYAALMTAVITDDISVDLDNDGTANYSDVSGWSITVDLKQKKDGWQMSVPITLAGVTSGPDGGTNTDGTWKGKPISDGICTVSCSNEGEVVFDWSGGNIAMNLKIRRGNWTGSSTKFSSGASSKSELFSTQNPDKSKYEGLYELKPETTYRVSVTYDPLLTQNGSETTAIICRSTLLYNDDGKKALDSGSGKFVMDTDLNQNGVNYRYTTNSDGTITYTATFTTPSGGKNYYYGMNFGSKVIYEDGSFPYENVSLSSMGSQESQVEEQVRNSFVIEEVK